MATGSASEGRPLGSDLEATLTHCCSEEKVEAAVLDNSSETWDVLATGIQCTTNGNVLFTDSWAINFYDDLHARH